MRKSLTVAYVLGFTFVIATAASAQQARRAYPPVIPDAETEVYKQVDGVKLQLYIFKPADWKAEDKRAAVVFFFGGGWQGGSPMQFAPQCRYLASRGIVAIAADYRVRSRHGVKVPQCVADAKSAIRWVRAHARQLGIDPNRIVASGGSAGGHLAACTGLVEGLDEPDEDHTISSKPNAMVLFNPAVILAPISDLPWRQELLERIKDRVGADPKAVSPYHHIKPGAPPTLIFHGTADKTVPFRSVELFAKKMLECGNKCELVAFEGAGHGFFNFGRDNNKPFVQTLRKMDEFLVELGFLTGEPTITQENASQFGQARKGE